ncbi:MAG: hypothetical protein HY093_01355 [Candidatus Liptonbacteria bacterium]|nr:hypothetical protein [Candidatus Liptonbacteria bacterium]
MFVRLTEKIAATFGTPPFEGKYPKINPHSTLANNLEVEIFEKLQKDIVADVAPKLPIEAVATKAWLMEKGEDGYWRTRSKFYFRA